MIINKLSNKYLSLPPTPTPTSIHYTIYLCVTIVYRIRQQKKRFLCI